MVWVRLSLAVNHMLDRVHTDATWRIRRINLCGGGGGDASLLRAIPLHLVLCS